MKKNSIAIFAVLLIAGCSQSEKYGDSEQSAIYFYTSDTPKRAVAKVLAVFSQNEWQELNTAYDDGTSLLLRKGNYYVHFYTYGDGLVKVCVNTQEKPDDPIRWIVAGKIRETVSNLVKTSLD
jgi:hypothetical protein